ncbi:MAG: hypothetical protein A2186_02390 [Candidatus Levybacteria bacterium RIFOXYA1_FULL_41_10]|nr:MAG: hypothetical protein UU15_C0018G0009 [Candidatus Levybacteria bacterium GW2011_GWC2_40_7]KKR94985.1 MAG: hypothetical protein UU45_C0005G0043 [Candidatus Levybacteria bacterium GW2011_GWA2_41_15]KKS00300.1 MAG: hypothetical protein UU52_C0038G0009 [Candidatus Levybacteria bacterium GW2011_GWB1_41_21]OGH27682.1 MAG: hypothetical protein A3D82_03980 [Candidatus Levybacteria bacterium RIFCSPHIGHO2_02_FULL_40_29]OGH32782.1 MAG: hypothetical protein A3E70_00615 [Candidatus Levybacteria bacte
MNKKINIDALTFKTLYSDYKPFLAPILTILGCIMLFLIVILPQLNEFLRSQTAVTEERRKLGVLQNNLSTLERLSDKELESQLALVSSALPSGKNFEAIINALSYSANVSGTILGNFDFAVGSLTEAPAEIQKFPSLEIDINLSGDATVVSSFLQTLNKTLPISRVVKIGINPGSANIKLAFYYKPFPPPGFNENAVISPVGEEGLFLIKELEAYNNPSTQPLPTFENLVSSEAAVEN